MPFTCMADPLATTGRSGGSPAFVVPLLPVEPLQETHPLPYTVDFQ
jgi:hypothetical protein